MLIARANGARSLVGMACRVSETRPKLMLSDKILRLVPDAEVVDPEFLVMLISSDDVRRQIGNLLNGGSGQNNISQADVRGLAVPDVPLAEQRQIVAAHAAFERRIAALERIVAKRMVMRNALVERLFTNSSMGLTRLGSVSESIAAGITLGSHRVPRQNPTGYLRVANVRKGWIDIDDVATLEAEERDRPRYELTTGDVLVVEGHADPGQIGRSAVVTERESGLLYQNHLFRLRFNNVLPDFAALWLNSSTVRGYWQSRCATSSGLYTINSRLLSDAPFARAGLAEQQRIVEAQQAANRSVEGLRRQINKLLVLQHGFTEDSINGTARLPQP
ncbi:hypothetical protein B7755_031915 [Streptomyces sp. NBS 14/10]|uniref:restriction endonuclease subunit S n=1 Tax=Streptomyces sp. NBS 14/10 TaxID=1945643 RepID=UPI00117F6969|nr:hypothetical protein [Streptomyces sp. NBS 14/10]KAK1182334.1 hypothetical protein B7755_031915 [Streptomyces sp. NBS 14/10]